ncbi:hypothetical protein GOP47_0014034 [Adiantum capillus-veneris]|uniref:Pyrimidine 5-nucleotidase n=1 Tax=Adiantum capillus-veneris TaxID=13818 RepID=A0A9D4ZDS9_ADICA|nr:hypothetical protein GOP47_0014034 [Adiantum capillus-veneris]
MECLIFDLDDTLYPLSSGISAACSKNIIDFMVQRLGIPAHEALQLSLTLYKNHGTTMAGLVALGYAFNFDEYHQFVHGPLPYHALHHEPVLRDLLLSLPHRKLVFTNADRAHACQVLSRLGIEDCFETVICFETLNSNATTRIVCKPSLEAFEHAIRIMGVDVSKSLFFDDSRRNIEGAKLAGLRGVVVGSSVPGVACIESVHALKEALPVLWQEEDEVDAADVTPQISESDTLPVPAETVSVAAS